MPGGKKGKNQGGVLGTTQTTLHLNSGDEPKPRLTRQSKRRKQRARKHLLREKLRKITRNQRLKKCGHTPVTGGGVMVRKNAQNIAGFAGLSTCGSGAVCPVCSAKIATQRAQEITELLTNARKQGYNVAMMTFTVRHHKGQSLAELHKAVTYAWSRVTSGKKWQGDKSKYDIVGYVRAVEVTHGRHGWHVHIHALVIYLGEELGAYAFGSRMWNTWEKSIEKKGLTAIANKGGFDVTISKGNDSGALGAYLAKQANALAKEVTLGAQKLGRKENRTPFQILSDFFETGDEQDLNTWYEWESYVKGKKFLTFSKGLRQLLSMQEELTDEQIAEQELGSSIDDVLLLPAETWKEIRAVSYKVLDIIERLGKSGLVRWIEEKGLAWAEPPGANLEIEHVAARCR